MRVVLKSIRVCIACTIPKHFFLVNPPARHEATVTPMGGVQSSDSEESTDGAPAEAIDPLKITDFRRTVKLFNALMDSDAERNAELLAET
jgi:hypothetical protein